MRRPAGHLGLWAGRVGPLLLLVRCATSGVRPSCLPLLARPQHRRFQRRRLVADTPSLVVDHKAPIQPLVHLYPSVGIALPLLTAQQLQPMLVSQGYDVVHPHRAPVLEAEHRIHIHIFLQRPVGQARFGRGHRETAVVARQEGPQHLVGLG